MLLRIIYIVVLWVFVDQVFLDSEGLIQIPDLTALDTRHNIFISGSFSQYKPRASRAALRTLGEELNLKTQKKL